MADQVSSYVVIGNGIAGITACEILRAEDAAAEITVIADDPFPVYYRPALKDYLGGRVREDKLWARPTSFYLDHQIRFLADRVVGIQPEQHLVQLASGKQTGYQRLLLATGARANSLTCPGSALAGVFTLRTVADYQRVLDRLKTARRIVVYGSGTLALETIETLRHRGYQVIHVLRGRLLWSEVLDPTASDLMFQQERRDGVEVRMEEEIVEITGKQGRISGAVTSKGTQIACDALIVAIGIEPLTDFITDAGITCGRGVQVDETTMRTSAPDVYAAGDLLETAGAIPGQRRLLGQWYPAIQQARAAAYSMLDVLDTSRPFRFGTFYNATFLYGLDFAAVGLNRIPKEGQSYQEIVADPQPRSYQKVILKDGVAVGALTLGNRKGALAFKRAIDHRVNLSSVAARLFASDFKLSAWLDQQGVPAPILGVTREGVVAVREAARTGIIRLPTAEPAPLTQGFLVLATTSAEQTSAGKSVTRLSQTAVNSIGRQAGATLQLTHDSVSRRHAEISYDSGQYVLRDLGSSNGTYVNGEQLAPGAVHVLKDQDWLRIGTVEVTFEVRLVESLPEAAPEEGAAHASIESERPTGLITLPPDERPTGLIALPSEERPTSLLRVPEGRPTTSFNLSAADLLLPPSSPPALNADGSLPLPGGAGTLPADVAASLKDTAALVLAGQGSPQVFRLAAKRPVQIGRAKESDIPLADVTVSRKHAEVFAGPDGFYIRDLGSSNGALVNQTKIDNPYRLGHGDRVKIGAILLYFVDLRAPDVLSASDAQPAAGGSKR